MQGAANKRERVVWVTNHQAPYRVPLWRSLEQCTDLEVAFVHAFEPKRGWRYQATDQYKTRLLSGTQIGLLARLMRHHEDPPRYVSIRELRGLLGGASAVVVGGWDQVAYLEVLCLASLLKLPTVLFYESTTATHRFTRGPIPLVRRWAMRRADIVLTPGPAASTAAVAAGARPDAVRVAPNAVDVPAVREIAQRARPAEPPANHAFAYVGQLIPRKNVDGLLRAFAALPGTPTLDIIGDGDDRQQLQTLARQLNIARRVRWHGHVAPADVPRYLAEAQTLVLVSHEEVWGMVVNEAIACGLAIVVSRNAGVASSVDGVSGVYLTDTDDAAIAAALRTSAAAWTRWDDSDARSAALLPSRSSESALLAIRDAIDRKSPGTRRVPLRVPRGPRARPDA